MKLIWELFRSFFCIGAFTFGGGYAMLPMLQKEVVEKHGWVTETELLDCYAIAQCTPGVIAVNTATYVGNKVKKGAGVATATFAVVLPSFIIISLIAYVLGNISHYPAVNHAFAGIRVAVAVLVGKALITLYKKGVSGVLGNAIFLISLLLSILTNVSPVILVIAAIVFSVILRKVEKAK